MLTKETVLNWMAKCNVKKTKIGERISDRRRDAALTTLRMLFLNNRYHPEVMRQLASNGQKFQINSIPLTQGETLCQIMKRAGDISGIRIDHDTQVSRTLDLKKRRINTKNQKEMVNFEIEL